MLRWAASVSVVVRMLDHIPVINNLGLFESSLEDVDVCVVF